MAIAKCRECSAEVSDSAKVCPKCGVSRPVKKTSLLTKIAAGTFGFAILVAIIGGMNREPPAAPKPPTEAEKKEEEQFNTAMVAVKLLKQSAKDPSSFEINSLLLMDNSAACMEYAARNSFNARVPGRAVQTPDLKLFVSEKDSAFPKMWNNYCGNRTGIERAKSAAFRIK